MKRLRFSKFVYFRIISAKIRKIDIQTEYLRNLLKEQEIDSMITEDAREFLANRGFNPVYGARPLKRTIRQLVENPLSKLLLSGKFTKGDTVIIDLKDDEIEFNKEDK